jgi:hypothetical protein
MLPNFPDTVLVTVLAELILGASSTELALIRELPCCTKSGSVGIPADTYTQESRCRVLGQLGSRSRAEG